MLAGTTAFIWFFDTFDPLLPACSQRRCGVRSPVISPVLPCIRYGLVCYIMNSDQAPAPAEACSNSIAITATTQPGWRRREHAPRSLLCCFSFCLLTHLVVSLAHTYRGIAKQPHSHQPQPASQPATMPLSEAQKRIRQAHFPSRRGFLPPQEMEVRNLLGGMQPQQPLR